jgi:integrase/recombinase XerC
VGQGDDAWVRDVRRLQLPVLGRVQRDEHGAWQVVGADGAPVSAVDAFLVELSASDCASSTCRSYAADLLRWLRFCAAIEVPWQQATRREVRWLRVAPNRQRRRRPGAGGRPAPGTLNPATGKAYLAEGYAPRTINHALSVLSAFYAFAVSAGLGPLTNPVPTARRGPDPVWRRRAALRQKQPASQPRDLPASLLAELFGVLRCERDRALVTVALTGGLRAGELLSMTVDGVDPGRGTGRIVPKGGTVPVWAPSAPSAFTAIGRYLLTRPRGRPGELLWLTRRQPPRPLTYFALRQVLERANAELGANISWHDLRHTFSARLLADEQISLTDTQLLMRHSNLATLAAYSTTRVEELAARLATHAETGASTPAATVALRADDGYDLADLQVLFPGLPGPDGLSRR